MRDKERKLSRRLEAAIVGRKYAATRPAGIADVGGDLLRGALGWPRPRSRGPYRARDGATVGLATWALLAAIATVAGVTPSPPTVEVTIDYRKWPARPLRRWSARLLGEDEHGRWLGITAGSTLWRGSTPVATVDHPFVVVVPHEGWWLGRHFGDGGWKLDVATPASWHDAAVIADDLALDVRRLHGVTWVEDEDEFSALCANGEIPPGHAEAARATVEVLRHALEANAEPFATAGDHWLGVLASLDPDAASRRAVLFDMGGVLTRPGDPSARRHWERRLGLDDGALHEAMRTAIGGGWEAGRDGETMLSSLADDLGVDLDTADEIAAALAAGTQLDPALVSWIESQRALGVRVAVVSNNGPLARRYWERHLALSRLVDLVVISAEERIAKPAPAIYLAAAHRLGVVPGRCAFVDDTPECVDGAAALGMRGVLHRDAASTVSALDAWCETTSDR